MRYLIILILFFSTLSYAAKETPKVKQALLVNHARKLLDLQQWDKAYKNAREKEMSYLLGSINDNSLQNLSADQKKQVIIIMRKMVVNQLEKDRSFFKDYLLKQYSKSFDQDELVKLINYYKTPTMQMMIDSKVKYKKVSLDELTDKLETQPRIDKDAMDKYMGGYLKLRYDAFLKKVNPEINKMIYEREQQILGLVFKQLPQIVKSVE